MIKFTSYLPMVGGSPRVLRLLPPLKTGRHDIAEILLKVALSTINQIKSNRFDNIGGIIDNHCLKYFFIIKDNNYTTNLTTTMVPNTEKTKSEKK